jgi:hypothetical protein
MKALLTRLPGAALVALMLAPASAFAQVELESKATEITLTGRVHLQWNSTSVDEQISNEFLIRRARLTVKIKVNDWISGKVQPDYGEGKLSLKDAYLRLTFDRAFRATLGQFKRPFDLFELTSSTKILVIERAGGIRGLDSCSGPGGVCSYSRFTEKLELSDRDIGVMFDGVFGDGSRWRYKVSLTNGTGANDPEENGAKSFSGRLEFKPLDDLMVAGHLAAHDYVDKTGAEPEDDYAFAYGGDLEWGNYEEGLHVQAGVTAGDNWKNLDAGGDPSTFVTAQGIVTYKIPLRNTRFLQAIEPLGRVSWGEPDTGASDDEGFLLTPGLVFYLKDRNKFAVNLDIWAPSSGDTEYSIKAQSYLHF